MNQYVIYRVKDTEIGKKLKHMPYNELGELVQEVKAENYEQIYFGLLEDNKKPYQLRKDLEKQIEPGKKLEVGDVIERIERDLQSLIMWIPIHCLLSRDL